MPEKGCGLPSAVFKDAVLHPARQWTSASTKRLSGSSRRYPPFFPRRSTPGDKRSLRSSGFSWNRQEVGRVIVWGHFSVIIKAHRDGLSRALGFEISKNPKYKHFFMLMVYAVRTLGVFNADMPGPYRMELKWY
jgi:hypothetical protein